MACCKGRAQGARQNGEHRLVSSGRTMLRLVCCLNVGVARTWRSWRTRAPVCCNAEDGERSARSSRRSSDLAPLPLSQEERKEPSLGRCVCIWGGDRGLYVALPLDPLIPAPCRLLWEGGIGLLVIKWSCIYPVLHRIPIEGCQDLTLETCELLQPIKTERRVLGLFRSSAPLIPQVPKSSI